MKGGAPAVESSGGPSAPTREPSVPVQVTNVVQILADHLPDEYQALLIKIDQLKKDLDGCEKYRAQLESLATTAGVTLSPQG
jgi:hypothetical protein